MNLPNSLKGFVICILIVAFCNCKSKRTIQENQPKYLQQLDSLMRISKERGLFNGNVLIAKNDTVIYQKSFGFTDGTQQQQLNSNAVFNIGSIAKQFNGVAIMMLQERGLLNINDTISKFDLELPDWSKKVTISHLLNYASGVPQIDVKNFPRNDEEAWKIIRSVDTLLFEPGTHFKYDNSNVFLQKRIVEKVTGQSFEKFITENIIQPLHMTKVVFDPIADYPNRTSCYDTNKVQCPEFEFISGWPWMGINDLYKWINAMNSNLLISEKSFNTLLINPYVKERASSLGEYFEQEKLQRHNGTAIKFRSILLNDLKNDLVVILLANTAVKNFDISYAARDIMLGKEFEIPKKSVQQALKNDFIKSVDEGIKAYRKLKQKEPEEYNFDAPIELNRIGVDLYQRGKNITELIKIFKFGVSKFPNDIRLNSNLGEMYFTNKQYDLALINYKKVLEIDKTNENAKIMIKKINTILKK